MKSITHKNFKRKGINPFSFFIICDIISIGENFMSTLVWVLVIIGCLTYGVLATLIPYLKKKKGKQVNNHLSQELTELENQAKELLVNKAFDTFLKEGKDYTFAAKVEGAVLVKKIARWAYFDNSQKEIKALFSIETDKGVYCFQLNGTDLIMVESGVVLSMYPQLAPTEKVVNNAGTVEEIFEKIESNKEIEIKEKRTEEFDIKKAKEMFPFLPNDYLKFIKKYKFIDYKALQIGSFNWNMSNLTGNEHMQEYLDGYSKGYKVEDWFFIGSDGMGGEYAFSTKGNDEKIYYFDHDNPNVLMTYANFFEFMFEQLI